MAAELISGVPNEITVGFIGILGVAVGAMGTALGTWWTTRAQLRHDREQRECERIFALRRDVFLEYAEAATKPLLYLSKISNAEVSMNELGAIQQSTMGPAAKVHGVARLATVRALLNAQEKFIASLLKLMPLRLELDKLTYQISAVASQIALAERHADQLAESIHMLSRLPQSDARRIDDLVAAMKDAQAKHADLHEVRARITLERSKLQLSMAAQAAAKTVEYDNCLVRLNVAMREELGLPISDGYEQAVMDSHARVHVKQGAFSKHLANELGALQKLSDKSMPKTSTVGGAPHPHQTP
jgi:hypothetical protein